jgi:hypothetical protein
LDNKKLCDLLQKLSLTPPNNNSKIIFEKIFHREREREREKVRDAKVRVR